MKLIGYTMIGCASAIMASCGFTLDKWQTWAIIFGYIIGCGIVNWRN